jgi:hypothetical protein
MEILMKDIVTMALLIISAESHAINLNTVAGSYLTPEARKAILTYVEQKCGPAYPFVPSALNENTTSVYSQGTPEDLIHYTLVSYIDFIFPYSDDFERTEIRIEEYRENSSAPWQAQITGFDGAYACRQL